jgi:hypothetical protein
MKKKFITILAFLLFFAFNLSAQDSFQVLFQSSNDKSSSFILEDMAGNFIITGSEVDPIDGIAKNKIWKISDSGDTSSYRNNLGDFRSYFSYIDNTSESTYLLFGASGDTLHRLSYHQLTIVQTDTAFNFQ